MKKYSIITLLFMCVALSSCGNTNDSGYENNITHNDTFMQLENVKDEDENTEDISNNIEVEHTESIIETEVNKEDEQELVEEVIEKETVDTSESILAEMSFSDVTVETDNLTDELRDNVIFGMISSEDACACYELASRYLGSVDNMEISEWLTSVMYDDAYTKIFIINDVHYKFIIKYDKSMIYMTDNI
ncbi:MAG: hypothetical protein J6A59_10020 [Lachnospiraceae bacterium]|nr:hypothetical protein [Lachnospiraceae bacterium]